ncbi:flavin-binding monooxygenase [Rhizodiscina lignyota]|uniref:Flavin-binding monooxygenase n=1 Tax=Rhizodiscina lignyota TaxID=1504668 RepID=A0A9P4M4J5_9PEZI|nr:flavin-binding monooxygenase [Rhizodiscina lignyota]
MAPSRERIDSVVENGQQKGPVSEEVHERPLNSRSRVSVVCIGAGVSGIATAIRVQETLENCDFTIYEKNGDLGGTWLENRHEPCEIWYPGCACDVPAHAYTYTFEPNPDYSRYYVGSLEIHAYLKAVAKKHDVEKYVQYHHKLVSAVWNEELGLWELAFEVSNSEKPEETQYFQRTCNVLINAGGLLNNWKWPAITGLTTFKGHLCHSARWKDFDWEGKNIAVIGSGSSAIQIVPELQPIVGKMKAFIRSPTWIAPSQGFVDPKNEGPKNFHYTAAEKRKFREDPDEFLRYRKRIESDMNRTFDTFVKDSPKQKEAIHVFAKIMKDRLGGNEELASRLTPKFGVGCRRLTPGQNFLESLVKENVEVISDEIDHIEAEGLVTADGKLHKVDAIVCATGFNTTYRPRFKLVGRQGIPLFDLWADTNAVEAYLAMAIPGFPNYFMFLGPNAPISNGTLIPVMEKQSEYMIRFVDKMQRQNLKAFDVKSDVVSQLNERHQKFLQRMVFTDNCRSWYKGGRADGKVIGIWPGSSLHYFETISEPRYEDWDYVYRENNQWDFLGNGWTLLETKDRETKEEDLAFYLLKPKEVLEAPES